MIEYIINRPVKLIDHFKFYKDNTIWNAKYRIIKGKPSIPIRDRCHLSNYKKYLEATTNYYDKYCNYGLYMLFFNNYRVFYVGIAYDDIKDRICKHIVKLFGSNFGEGINHTNEKINNETKKGWRYYAKDIFEKYNKKNKIYNLDDCFMITINPINLKKPLNKADKKLEYIEKKISSNSHALISQITTFITNSHSNLMWKSFNKQEIGNRHNYKLISWDNNIIEEII